MSKRIPKPGSLCYIEWTDHYTKSATAWVNREDASSTTPEYCRSVGWVLKSDKDAVAIAAHIDRDSHTGDVGGQMTILKVNILRVEKLEVPG